MGSKGTVNDVLLKIKHLCQSRGFVYEVVSSQQGVQYGFGPAGSLLRKNIFHEWFRAMVTTQENTYVVEDPAVKPVVDEPFLNKPAEFQDLKCVMRNSLSEGCLSHYLRILELTSQKFPFTISQSGLYRNNTSSDTFLLSSRQQTGMMIQHYTPPSLSTQSFDNWQRSRLKWWRQYSQYPSSFSLSDLRSESGVMTTELQYDFSWGKDSIETIVNRGDLDLREMESESGFSHQGKHGRKAVFPVIVECCTSLEKAMLAFIADAFTEKEANTSKDKDKGNRMVLRLNRRLAPYKVALAISGSGGRELKEVSSHVANELRHAGMEVFDVMSDSNMSLENRTRRFDELGIPYSVILNATTLKDGLVGLRNRDTTLKEQVHISRLKDTLTRNVNFI